MARLTDQQKTFVAEYIRSGFDRQQAAKAASYSKKNWPSIVCKLLQKSQIKAEIDRLFEQIEQKSTVEAEEIIKELRKLAFAPISERVGNADRLRALELLGKYLAMWSERAVPEDPEKAQHRREFMKSERAEVIRLAVGLRLDQLANEQKEGVRVSTGEIMRVIPSEVI